MTSVAVAAEQLELLESLLVGSCELGLGLSGGPSLDGAGPEGSGHSPATWMPKILMHGRWNVGNSGNVGQSNSTSAISGTFHTISGSQVAQGNMIGTIVVELSLPVVVSHWLPVTEKSVKS